MTKKEIYKKVEELGIKVDSLQNSRIGDISEDIRGVSDSFDDLLNELEKDLEEEKENKEEEDDK